MTTTISVTDSLLRIPLPLSSEVSPALDSKHWSPMGTLAQPNGSPTNAVWFDRNDGITNGKTWVFTTTVELDGVRVLLQEKVTGTFAGSDMWQMISAGGNTTGWQDTNNTASLQFTGISGSVYRVVWTLSGSGSGYKNINYAVSCIHVGWRPTPPVMTQIKTIVMLMLENHSLDHVLGWLYDNSAPAIVYPPGSSPNFDGIPAGSSNRHGTAIYTPQGGTAGFHEPCRVPAFDPNEAMDHVQYQLYADANGNMPTGYFWANPPPMTGFAWDYYASYINQPAQVMGAYSAAELPVLYGLAASFAVSDRWFCSVPTQTDPNRAFSVCGTSLGAESNSDIGEHTYANANTLFNMIGDAGKTWGMFWQMDNPLGTGEGTTWEPFTSYYFPQMLGAPNGGVYTYDKFAGLASQGQLPNFCYLEPYWGGGKGDALDSTNTAWVGIQGNDYHPCAFVGPGEDSLNTLYNLLVNSPQWSNMLLIITFDEHGGTWDHVSPPAAVPPDDHVGKSGFKFDRLGVRVPTILVSPYIRPGTVFRAPSGSAHDFDHTSFIATLLKWAGVDPASAGLGARVAVAPTFEGVLSDEARTDKPRFTVPAGYASQGGGVGAINVLGVGTSSMDVHEFREAADESRTAAEFELRIRDLTHKAARAQVDATGRRKRVAT